MDTVELLENESLESAGLVVLHDKITPAKSATSLLRRLMEANLLKTKTAAVLVLYSGRTLLTREQKAQGSQRDVRQSTTGFTGYHMGVRLECVPGSEVYWTTIFCTDNIIWSCTTSVCSRVYRKLHHSGAYHGTTTPEPQTTCALDLLCSKIKSSASS